MNTKNIPRSKLVTLKRETFEALVTALVAYQKLVEGFHSIGKHQGRDCGDCKRHAAAKAALDQIHLDCLR
jgi:hypothetical protein